MKILYFGGQKSGKTSLSIKKTLEISGEKTPFYIATYLDTYNDSEMKKRIKNHQIERRDDFITIEEGHDVFSKLEDDETYLMDCVSMWILNNMEKEEEVLRYEIQKLLKSKNNMIFMV